MHGSHIFVSEHQSRQRMAGVGPGRGKVLGGEMKESAEVSYLSSKTGVD